MIAKARAGSGIRGVILPVYEAYLGARYGRAGLPVTINGEPFHVRPSQRSLLAWDEARRSRIYEAPLWARLMGAVRSDDTIVDVGAHVGIYVLGFARRAEWGRVVAVEPDPANLAALRSHLAMNGLTERVDVVPGAAGAAGGDVEIAIGHDRMSTVGNPYGFSHPHLASVPVVALDELLPGGADILKIDVEGYEGRVLEGARRLLAHERSPRLVMIELHLGVLDQTGWSQERVLSALHEAGYQTTVESDIEGGETPAPGSLWERAVVFAERRAS